MAAAACAGGGGGGGGGDFPEHKGSVEWIMLSCLAFLFLFHSSYNRSWFNCFTVFFGINGS